MATQGARLFGRTLTCVIGSLSASWEDKQKLGLAVSGFDIEANIQRNLLGAHPNTAHVGVYNMSERSRQLLSAGAGTVVPVVLSAGYQGQSDTVFRGTARYVWSDIKGPDAILQFRSGDLETAMLSRGQVPSAPKVNIQDAFTALAQAMGAGLGNIAQALAKLGSPRIATVRSGALYGPAVDRMTQLSNALGLEWSIQNGAVQMMPLGQPSSGTIYDISASSGMVESPNVDSKGLLKFKTLLLPGLGPGNLVRMNAKNVKGIYRVERCNWNLKTFGNEWYQEIEGMATGQT